MLNNKEFDLWADEYDKTVSISDEKGTYPFAGYRKILGFIFQTVNIKAVRRRMLRLRAGFLIKDGGACIRKNAERTSVPR